MTWRLRVVYCDGAAWVVTAEDERGLLTLERMERLAEGGTRHRTKHNVPAGSVTPVRKEARA